jgi:hypothetical protein
MNVSYWVWIGIIYLIILVVQDYKEERMVDDRFNFFMMGVSISLISHFHRPLWLYVVYIIVLLGMYWFLKKMKALGEADLKTIAWILLGYSIINTFYLLVFSILLLLATLLTIGLKKYLFKIKAPTPFYGVLFIIFIFSNYLFGLYG